MWQLDTRIDVTPLGRQVSRLHRADQNSNTQAPAKVGFDMLDCAVCSAPIRPKLVYETGREWVMCNDCAGTETTEAAAERSE